MKNNLKKVGKFYSSVFMGNIGIFIFIGILSVIYQKNGWFPNENIYAISQFVYKIILPLCIAYTGGQRISGHEGGIVAVLMLSGMLSSDVSSGVLAGMIAGVTGGFVWKKIFNILGKYMISGMEMFFKNTIAAFMGIATGLLGYYLFSDIVTLVNDILFDLLKKLSTIEYLPFLNIVIEPAKILFLNNIINHGVLTPIGIEEVKEIGKSVLFLIETNPGPGFGVILALYILNKEKRNKYGAIMFIECVGGLHEVYFPIILSNMLLIIPLIAGGMTGTFLFKLLDAGISVPVSPGSIISILLVAGKGNVLKLAVGIIISMLVSFILSLFILLLSKKFNKLYVHESLKEGSDIDDIKNIEIKSNDIDIKKAEMKSNDMNIKKAEIKSNDTAVKKTEERSIDNPKLDLIEKIGFVCDAGMGTSVMGTALLKRKLSEDEKNRLDIKAYAIDQIPDDLDILVCQKDFQKLLPDDLKNVEYYIVDNFMNSEEYINLIERLRTDD